MVEVVEAAEGTAVVIVKGRYSNEPGGRRRTLDVLLGRTGERVTVLRSSVEVYA